MMAAMYDQMARDQRRGRIAGPVKARRLGRASNAGKQAEPVAGMVDAETVKDAKGASWRDLHWKQQVRLAQDMGADVTTTAEARAFLESEHG